MRGGDDPHVSREGVTLQGGVTPVRLMLDRATELAPGREGPTISPLGKSGWVAVRVMVPRAGSQRLMDELYLTDPSLGTRRLRKVLRRDYGLKVKGVPKAERWTCGVAARDELIKRFGGKSWTCQSRGAVDRRGRTVARCQADGSCVGAP